MTLAQRNNLNSARALAASRVGWQGEPAALPYSMREAYVTELAKIILAYPERFDAQTIATAQVETGDKPNSPLATYGTAEALADFVDEAGNQAQAINPLSAQNRTWTAAVLVVLAAFALYLFIPRPAASSK